MSDLERKFKTRTEDEEQETTIQPLSNGAGQDESHSNF
jgi:hypothetical protein